MNASELTTPPNPELLADLSFPLFLIVSDVEGMALGSFLWGCVTAVLLLCLAVPACSLVSRLWRQSPRRDRYNKFLSWAYTVLLVASSLAVSFSRHKVYLDREISTSHYRTLVRSVEAYPCLAPSFQAMLTDGKISYGEARPIAKRLGSLADSLEVKKHAAIKVSYIAKLQGTSAPEESVHSLESCLFTAPT